MSIDKKDHSVLEILKESSKLTTSQIAKKLNMPITTVHNRIKKLESSGVIKKFTIIPNYKLLDLSILSYILITVNYTSRKGEQLQQRDIAKKIKSLQEVEEVNIMAGVTDLLIKIRVKDIDSLNEFIVDKLRNIDGIDKTQTMMVLSEV